MKKFKGLIVVFILITTFLLTMCGQNTVKTNNEGNTIKTITDIKLYLNNLIDGMDELKKDGVEYEIYGEQNYFQVRANIKESSIDYSILSLQERRTLRETNEWKQKVENISLISKKIYNSLMEYCGNNNLDFVLVESYGGIDYLAISGKSGVQFFNILADNQRPYEDTLTIDDEVTSDKTILDKDREPNNGTGSCLLSDTELWVYAKYCVEQQLKNPKSSKFTWDMKNEVIITKKSNEILIESWVESENSFGVTVKEKFIVVLTSDGNNLKDVYFY